MGCQDVFALLFGAAAWLPAAIDTHERRVGESAREHGAQPRRELWAHQLVHAPLPARRQKGDHVVADAVSESLHPLVVDSVRPRPSLAIVGALPTRIDLEREVEVVDASGTKSGVDAAQNVAT